MHGFVLLDLLFAPSTSPQGCWRLLNGVIGLHKLGRDPSRAQLASQRRIRLSMDLGEAKVDKHPLGQAISKDRVIEIQLIQKLLGGTDPERVPTSIALDPRFLQGRKCMSRKSVAHRDAAATSLGEVSAGNGPRNEVHGYRRKRSRFAGLAPRAIVRCKVHPQELCHRVRKVRSLTVPDPNWSE